MTKVNFGTKSSSQLEMSESLDPLKLSKPSKLSKLSEFSVLEASKSCIPYTLKALEPITPAWRSRQPRFDVVGRSRKLTAVYGLRDVVDTAADLWKLQ